MTEAIPTVGAEDLQQFFYESFGDRDWDVYNHNEHIFLKRNIGYALYGTPTEFEQNSDSSINSSVTGYNKTQNESIEEIYKVIKKHHFIEDSTKTLVRTIFVCCELKDKDLSVIPVPVFAVKKCHFGGENGPKKCHNDENTVCETCQIFIDTHGRVYHSWKSFLESNKLPKCTMVCPKKGKYSGEIIDEEKVKVLLERHESPACSLGHKILEKADTTETVVSVGTTLTFVAAAIPGVVVAHAVLAASAVGGLGVALYSVGRSMHTLVDRKKHEQSIGLDNSESRWAWWNTIVAGLGASVSAASSAIHRAISRGADVSKVARLAFNTINVAHMVGSAANLGFAGYDIIEKLIKKEKVSPLEFFQFASHVLFFHKSVVAFKTANDIISDTQTDTLHSYEQTLRSKRQLRLFQKAQVEASRLNGETTEYSEILSGINHIEHPDNFFAGLAKINKDLNKNDTRYVKTTDDEVEINTAYIVDPMEFYTVGVENRVDILKSLPMQEEPIFKMPLKIFDEKFSFISKYCQEMSGENNLESKIAQDLLNNRFNIEIMSFLLSDYPDSEVKLLIQLFIRLLSETKEEMEEEVKKIHPMVPFTIVGLQYLMNYLKNCADADNIEFSKFLDTCFNDDVNMEFMNKLVVDFKLWIKNQFEALKMTDTTDFKSLEKVKKDCDVCSGHHFITAS